MLPTVWVTKKDFHSRLTQTTWNSISFTFLSYGKTSDLHLILDDFYKKTVTALANCVKSYLKINCMEFCIHTEKDHLCFHKNSAYQISTFINSKVVYFKKHLTYQVYHPLETKFPQPLKVLYCHQTIKAAAGAMTELLHTWLKDFFRSLLFGGVLKELK